MADNENLTDADWREKLTPEQYRICREKGTERPFTGEYWQEFSAGDYRCRCCGELLFDAETKFDAGCGWPSFDDIIEKNVKRLPDADGSRSEIVCANCNAHLGHVFDDGPTETGIRYCVNSLSIDFKK